MGKRGPKTGLAERREMVSAAGELIQKAYLNDRSTWKLWFDTRREARVASKHINSVSKDEEGLPKFNDLTTHQKMKIAQDFMITAFMSPEIGVRFLEAGKQDPIAFAKLALSLMPKELHVDVQQQTGVVLLPMKAESLEAWTQMVEGHNRKEEIKDVTPEEFWEKKMGASDDVDDDSAAGDSSNGSIKG